MSDTITVRSIVGRFLEHSRILWFYNGGAPRVFIGSADLMERNLDRRVEALCPLHDRTIAGQLEQLVLPSLLQDTARAHVLHADGTYTLAEPPDGEHLAIDSQDSLMEWYAAEHRLAESGSGR